MSHQLGDHKGSPSRIAPFVSFASRVRRRQGRWCTAPALPLAPPHVLLSEDEVGRLLVGWRDGTSKAKIAMVTTITGTTGVSMNAEVRATTSALAT